MIIHDVAQGTTAWLQLRCGIPTASCFDSILTPGGEKGIPKKSGQWDKYMNHLLAERMLGAPIDGFKSQWMERGSELEHRAVASYELANECDTERIGFVTTDDGLVGCSPDRFIIGEPKGLLEAKAPTPAVHVAYLRHAAGASVEYKVQLQGQLWVCERDWVDIVSFHPGLADASFRVVRDDVFIKELEAHVRAFSYQLELLAGDFQDRGWIKPKAPEAEVTPDASFLSQADLDWAMSRFDMEAQ
jgi:hypothetical protein